jgi:glutamyl-tRNA synthetase
MLDLGCFLRYSKKMETRVRYAPSPTGLQHIGGVRTALFNYLFARSTGGKFILRLEDTDRTRSDEAFVRNLFDTFAWLGFSWDEGPDCGGPNGPYVQSERFDLYRTYARELLEKGKAYYCFCTEERLEKVRKEREAAKSPETGYDRHCRSIPPEEAARRAEAGEPCVIRLKIPLGESTCFHDHILGDIAWKNEDISPDPVLLKSDGFPTYHLANVIDDHLMGITHVLRAQEWVPSTPLHVILYAAFGWTHPEFCHLPMVMGQDGKKLSKRHGATGIDEFRLRGYLPEALLNYIALLGCSYEEGQDIFSLVELGRLFSLDSLNKAPAVFDYKKLEWYNGQYIRLKSDEELAALALPFAVEEGLFGDAKPDSAQQARFGQAMALVKERAVFVKEIPGKIRYLFSAPPLPPPEDFVPKKGSTGEALRLLALVRPLAGELCGMGEEEAENTVKAFAEKEGVKMGDLLMPLRAAVTGSRVSPPLFGSLRLLGREETLRRIDRALSHLR